jgi:hypothetical protein
VWTPPLIVHILQSGGKPNFVFCTEMNLPIFIAKLGHKTCYCNPWVAPTWGALPIFLF